MPRLKHKKLFTTRDEKSISIVGELFGGGKTNELQIQLEDDGSETFIDLELEEVIILRDSLNEWIGLFEK